MLVGRVEASQGHPLGPRDMPQDRDRNKWAGECEGGLQLVGSRWFLSLAQPKSSRKMGGRQGRLIAAAASGRR
jgi:hypothetical protein